MQKPFLVVLRSEAHSFKAFLQNKKFDTLYFPLTEAVYHPCTFLVPPRTQGVIVTSRHALYALRSFDDIKCLPLYGVGDSTIFFGQSHGFQEAYSAAGTALDLIALVQKCKPELGPFLYARGQVVRHDLAHMLYQKGFQVQEEVVYHMNPLTISLPFFENYLAYAWGLAFFSVNTAQIFLSISKNCLPLKSVYFFCLSEAIADTLKPIKGKIKIAEYPTALSLAEVINDTSNRYFS